jgi:4-phospho-D-threonate 3-dehydrogenase / 4-phospho-D-erythronate 3-dehydrogenase
MDTRPIVAITMGDPAGIGPEVIIKGWQEQKFGGICRPLVIGDLKILQENANLLRANVKLEGINSIEESIFSPDRLLVLDLNNIASGDIRIGQINAGNGRVAAEYIFKAVELALARKVHGIATSPINKEALNLDGYPYPGHTELLAKLTHTNNYAMMMVGGPLRVVLVTTHLSLKEVCSKITHHQVLKIINLTHRSMGCFEIPKPKIALAALNPHAGEGGLFGQEERQCLIPAIKEAQRAGIDTTGPYPADTLFQHDKSKNFDVIIAMYHDQGLIPVKMTAFGRAVNVTLGLPIIRTSVDHGTAYDIAGKGQANPGSLIEAVKLAARMKSLPC